VLVPENLTATSRMAAFSISESVAAWLMTHVRSLSVNDSL